MCSIKRQIKFKISGTEINNANTETASLSVFMSVYLQAIDSLCFVLLFYFSISFFLTLLRDAETLHVLTHHFLTNRLPKVLN